MVKLFFEEDDSWVASDWVGLKDIGDLLEVVVIVFPDEEDRNSLEGVDEREEKAMDEVVVMNWIELIERSHHINQDLAEFVLAACTDTRNLEETNKQSHSVIAVFNQDALWTFNQLHNLDRIFSLKQLLSTTVIKAHCTNQLDMTQWISYHSICLLILQ